MLNHIPPISEVRAVLAPKTHADLRRLADASGVPFSTLWKIRAGITKNPGIETVRQFYAALDDTSSPAATVGGTLAGA